MKKNKVILIAGASIGLGAFKNPDVVVVEESLEKQKAFENPSAPILEGEMLPTNPVPIKKTNPWPEPHRSSKRRRRY